MLHLTFSQMQNLNPVAYKKILWQMVDDAIENSFGASDPETSWQNAMELLKHAEFNLSESGDFLFTWSECKHHENMWWRFDKNSLVWEMDPKLSKTVKI